ncbi:SAV_915 family protein [Streptomyces abyssomicinicus]|uniref:SAV_915 family protein n=1 Tax=Streptomyces abyssomicinicus TaxID=574929 RepID=UPI001FE986F0|nr:SAV_915 family protein [Streptomyces abyssomicinicus]
MDEQLHDEDPEPSERFPAGPLYVPVRPGPSGCAARLFRTPLGARTAVGFSSGSRLAATLGHDHAWIRLAEPALRALTAPLGFTTVTVDPLFTAPAPAPAGRAVPDTIPDTVPGAVPGAVADKVPGVVRSALPGVPAQRLGRKGTGR